MAATTIPYLKHDRGRWFYRRRVPAKLQSAIGESVWSRPCGDVSEREAVQMVVGWTAEHDDLIKRLKNDPDARREREDEVREVERVRHRNLMARTVTAAVSGRTDPIPYAGGMVFDPTDFDPLGSAKALIAEIDGRADLGPKDKAANYRNVMESFFAPHVPAPKDADTRDEWEMVRRKLERRMSDIEGSPDRLTEVLERCIVARQITTQVSHKYRRHVRRLVDHLGDVPIRHVTSSHLRSFRDLHQGRIEASSVASMFAPIKSMFSFALEEELIDTNPMASVVLKREKRAISEIRWKPFTPPEMQRIFSCLDDVWANPIRNLAEERRLMVVWGIRVLSYTAMRPVEFTRLQPKDVTEDHIQIRASKTKSSSRIIPLHPSLTGFPEFVHGGGLDCLKTQKKDTVQTVRHNFTRLIRQVLDPPIIDDRKALYSLRSTFSNAMRRAGASPDIRRAILGHSEKGALGHYDDGVEFEVKRKWVNRTDPLKVYTYGGEDDDLGSE